MKGEVKCDLLDFTSLVLIGLNLPPSCLFHI